MKFFEKQLHFFCLYHLYTNLKGFYKGSWSNEFRKKMVGLFKRCAHAPTKSLFHQRLDEFIEDGGPLASKFLESLPNDKLAVTYSPNVVHGEMTSNAAESFNNWITEIRGLPVTYMMDVFRRNIMRKFVQRRNESNQWTVFLCKRKEKFWNQAKQAGRSW